MVELQRLPGRKKMSAELVEAAAVQSLHSLISTLLHSQFHVLFAPGGSPPANGGTLYPQAEMRRQIFSPSLFSALSAQSFPPSRPLLLQNGGTPPHAN